jgi:hypothetical protein
MPSKRFSKPTEFKVEFWTCASGKDRKHRNRFYATAEGMIRAGARWEAKGGDYWCRYWNGLSTWVSATRGKLDPAAPRTMPETLGRASELASITHIGAAIERREGARAGRRTGAQVFSVFGVCEATAAEIMLKDGRATRKIPVDEIPESALFNEFGNKALFAVMVPGERVHEFNELIKDLRA